MKKQKADPDVKRALAFMQKHDFSIDERFEACGFVYYPQGRIFWKIDDGVLSLGDGPTDQTRNNIITFLVLYALARKIPLQLGAPV